jgi:DNA-directed RNA polymerase specialized sigma24 family protein
MSLNIRSSTSPFWSKYRKNGYNSRGLYLAEYDEFEMYEWDEVVDPDQKPEDISAHECMHIAIDGLNFYYKQLIHDYYIQGLTYQQIREKYGITISSIRKDVKEGVRLIQEKCISFVPKNLKP